MFSLSRLMPWNSTKQSDDESDEHALPGEYEEKNDRDVSEGVLVFGALNQVETDAMEADQVPAETKTPSAKKTSASSEIKSAQDSIPDSPQDPISKQEQNSTQNSGADIASANSTSTSSSSSSLSPSSSRSPSSVSTPGFESAASPSPSSAPRSAFDSTASLIRATESVPSPSPSPASTSASNSTASLIRQTESVSTSLHRSHALANQRSADTKLSTLSPSRPNPVFPSATTYRFHLDGSFYTGVFSSVLWSGSYDSLVVQLCGSTIMSAGGAELFMLHAITNHPELKQALTKEQLERNLVFNAAGSAFSSTLFLYLLSDATAAFWAVPLVFVSAKAAAPLVQKFAANAASWWRGREKANLGYKKKDKEEAAASVKKESPSVPTSGQNRARL